jgi:putative tricarboxylic transport membrane protein
MRIASPKDAVTGLLLIVLGATALVLLRNVPVGTATRMGPGYYPGMVSWILIGFGAFILARSFLLTGPPLERWSFRALIPVLAAVGVFSIGIDPPPWLGPSVRPLGLFLTILLLVVVGSLASRETRAIEVVLSAVVLAGFSVLLFIVVLGLPLRPWPEYLELLR